MGAQVIVSHVPPTTWGRFILFFFRQRWRVQPLLRLFRISNRMTWGEVRHAVLYLRPQIATYGPEVVVGVGVGGAIFGALIAGNLGDLPFLALDRRVSYANRERQSSLIDADVCSFRRALIANKRVLLVHGELVSGQTTQVAKAYLQELGAKDIEVACIDFRDSANPQPEHPYIRTTDIIMKPWTLVNNYICPDAPVRGS